MFIDFAELKERVTIEQVVALLDLKVKTANNQMRGACPACKSGGQRALVITPEREAYYCFTDQKGGDCIGLVSHIKGISAKDAAQFIHNSLTVPQEKVVKQTQKLQPLQHLVADHDAVLAVGLCPTIAATLGIGYATKGVARGNVVIPVRDEDGNLHGYLGVQELTFIPKDFQPPDNVVPLRKRGA